MQNNKVIVVTGGAGLLGSTFIKEIAKQGWQAIIADINEDRAQKVIAECAECGYPKSPYFIKLDINDEESINKSIASIFNMFGKIDGLVNNAYPRNRNYGKHFFDVKYDDFCENINLNIGGYFLCSQKFGGFFKQQGHGNIINMGSVYGVIAPKFEVYDGTEMTLVVEYAVIKSALLHLTKYMAKYFKGLNIRVNAICPGGIFDYQNERFLAQYNDQCLNKGMLDPSDISGLLIFLLSDSSEYINGQIISVDDGFTL